MVCNIHLWGVLEKRKFQEVILIFLRIRWSKYYGRGRERISPIIFSVGSCFLILVGPAQEL